MINIIGAGLAGTEAAIYLAKKGYQIKLYEKKKLDKNEIQKTDNFAELVCSNSFRSKSILNAAGILKKEMELLESELLKIAYETSVDADDALAVDRDLFSSKVTERINSFPNIEVINQEYVDFNKNDICLFAPGPLISSKFERQLNKYINNELYYLDASAPLIEESSINKEKIFYASRHGEDNSYICIPLNEEEFNNFVDLLIKAKRVSLKDFEEKYFKGCQPIEVMARESKKILLNGPMSPNNLLHNNVQPYAVVMLRKDNAVSSIYNIVGFQTNLTISEQNRAFKTLPGLENVNILRYGVLHKNNYINSPRYINSTMQLKSNKKWFFAGQITGVEGYIESMASGLITARWLDDFISKKQLKPLPNETVLGSLISYITNEKHKKINPMKSNIGILPTAKKKFSDKNDKNKYLYNRSIESLKNYLK